MRLVYRLVCPLHAAGHVSVHAKHTSACGFWQRVMPRNLLWLPIQVLNFSSEFPDFFCLASETKWEHATIGQYCDIGRTGLQEIRLFINRKPVMASPNLGEE